MDQFLVIWASKLKQNNLNRAISSSDIEAVNFKNPPVKKKFQPQVSLPMDFTRPSKKKKKTDTKDFQTIP